MKERGPPLIQPSKAKALQWRICRQPTLLCHLPRTPQVLSMDPLGAEPEISAKVSSPGVGSPGKTKATPGRNGHQALRKGILLPKLLICD